ncbi:UNVERIFIED_CONTAM: hypothetical protein K2H54_056187 [Gekko kuhli]
MWGLLKQPFCKLEHDRNISSRKIFECMFDVNLLILTRRVNVFRNSKQQPACLPKLASFDYHGAFVFLDAELS